MLLDRDDPRNQEHEWAGADLAVEIVSPSDPNRDLVEKRAEYAAAEIAEYWIVDPRPRRRSVPTGRSVTVLCLNDDGTYAGEPVGRGGGGRKPPAHRAERAGDGLPGRGVRSGFSGITARSVSEGRGASRPCVVRSLGGRRRTGALPARPSLTLRAVNEPYRAESGKKPPFVPDPREIAAGPEKTPILKHFARTAAGTRPRP